MNKVIRNGEVAVAYSPGYGAGWSTWLAGTLEEQMRACMDASITQPILDGDTEAAVAAALVLFPEMYTGGGKQLKIEWIPVGEQFGIEEYDGSESVSVVSETQYMKA